MFPGLTQRAAGWKDGGRPRGGSETFWRDRGAPVRCRFEGQDLFGESRLRRSSAESARSTKASAAAPDCSYGTAAHRI